LEDEEVEEEEETKAARIKEGIKYRDFGQFSH